MPESATQLRERALHYRKLAALATDARLIGVILDMAGEFEARARELERWRIVK